MKRKILSFVLVLCVTFTITGSAFASNGNGNYEKTKENDMFVMNVAQKADVGIEAEYQFDDKTKAVVKSFGEGRIVADEIYDGTRYTNFSFKNGEYCAIVKNDLGVSMAFKDKSGKIIEYNNGIKVGEYSGECEKITYKLKEDVEQYLQKHSISEIISEYDATISESGEIILPNECYNVDASNIENKPKAAKKSVYPAGKVTTKFPTLTQSEVLKEKKYVSSLKKNVDFMVTTSRNSYVKNDEKFFQVAKGITLAVLSTKINVAVGLLGQLLSAASLLDSANSVIENFQFLNESSYKVYFSKVGWVKDSTAFESVYVRYIGTTVTGYGKIALTWDQNDGLGRSNFQWKVISQPSQTTKSNEYFRDMTHDTYNNDITYNGRCSTDASCMINYGGAKI